MSERQSTFEDDGHDSREGDKVPSLGSEPELQKTLNLSLRVTDPEVINELLTKEEGEQREAFALLSLRIGIIALRQVSGQIDISNINEAGEKLIKELEVVLNSRGSELTNQIGKALTQYFDPTTGLVSQRLQNLTQKDGELERLLAAQLGPEDSVLAKTLVRHIGEGSSIFNMLSPTHSTGLRAQVEKVLEETLSQQREAIIKEFSLDQKESALSRLVAEVNAKNEKLGQDLSGQVDELVDELSLDHPDSALSRLVGRVEQAHQKIAEQFSSDNEESALTKLSKILQNTNTQIVQNLSLDNESSALARLRKELKNTLEEMSTKNSDFQTDVRQTLAALQARKKESERSTRHGIEFELELEKVLSKEAQEGSDIWQSVGNNTGAIKNCKVGDYLTILGKESHAAGVRIVWEAKEDKSYDLKKAVDELEVARKNRQAQIGVFVFSKKTAPEGLNPFARYGQDLILIWDAEDPTTDIYIKAAFSITKALAVKSTRDSDRAGLSLEPLENAVRGIERQIKYLDEFKTWADTVTRNGQKISERAEKMKSDLRSEIAKLDYLRIINNESPPLDEMAVNEDESDQKDTLF